MAALLPVLPYVGEILTGAALLTYTVVNAFKKDKSDGLKEQVTALERQVMALTNLTMQSNKDKAEAEARLGAVQNALLVEQSRKEEQLRKEKEELKNAQAERERLMDKRNEQFERKQREMIEAEKEHQRLLAEEAREGLKRSHEEYERRMALDRERLAKEEEFLSNARLEHERCLEQERERLKQSQARYESAMEEDRQRLAHELNTFAEAQKKWDIDRVELKQNYDKLQTKLNEGYQQLRRDQQALEKRLQSKMEDMLDEQKNLSVLEKEQKLKDLTETYLSYCEMYGNDPENMTTETKEFQRKFKLQLTKVENSMQTGDNFLSKLDIWAKGVMLDTKMLTFLSHNDKVKPEALRASGYQYQREMGTLMSNFNASNALLSNADEVRAIENAFHDQVESYMSRPLPVSPSTLPAIETLAAARGSILSPTWPETWDSSERRRPSRSSSSPPAQPAPAPPARRSTRYLGRTVESDHRGKLRYSQDPQNSAAGFKHSVNKRESRNNRREPLDQQQHYERQCISCGKQGHRRMHDHDGGKHGRQKTSERREAPARQQTGSQKNQERRHFPDNRPESSERSSSSGDEQTGDWIKQGKPSRSSSRSSGVVSSSDDSSLSREKRHSPDKKREKRHSPDNRPESSGKSGSSNDEQTSDSSGEGKPVDKAKTCTFDSLRGKQRCSQDPQACATGRKSKSRNKRMSPKTPLESLDVGNHRKLRGIRHPCRDQKQHREEQYISCDKQGKQRMHEHDGIELERQKTGGRRNARAGPQPSRSKYQERSHSPDNRPESSEESGSSNDEQTRDWSEQDEPSRSSSGSSGVVPSASGSAHHLGRSFESDPSGNQRYSQDPQDCAAGRKNSRNKRESQQNNGDPLDVEYHRDFQGSRHPSRDLRQHHDEQYIPGAKHQETHDRDGGDQERQKVRERRNYRADRAEISSSSDENVSKYESTGKKSLIIKQEMNQGRHN